MSLFDIFKKTRSKKETQKETIKNLIIEPEIVTTALDKTTTTEQIYSKRFDGLLIGEIIFLNWADGKLTSTTVPRYFSYDYGINWIESEKKLLKDNLLRYGTPSESLSGLKVTELKTILEKNNLPKTGKKAQLIERITTEIPEINYANLIISSWKLSNDGKKFVKKYHHVIWAHQNAKNSLTVTPALVVPYIDSTLSSEQLAIKLSEKAMKKYISDVEYGLLYGELLFQATIKEKNGDLEDSLYLLIINTIFEFTGLGNITSKDYIYIYINQIFPNHIKSKIIELQQKLNYSTEQIVDIADSLYDLYEKNLFHIRLFKDKKEFLNAFTVMLVGTLKDFEFITEQWYKRLPSKYKQI